MNRLLIISSLLGWMFLQTSHAICQTKADDILGTWLSADKDGKIKIFKQGDKYYGKVIWGKDGTRIDTKNPDPKLRTQKIIGSTILKDFVFDGDDTWEEGTIYDPNNGKTYSSLMKLDNANTLNLRGYIGLSFIGRSTTWTRVKE